MKLSNSFKTYLTNLSIKPLALLTLSSILMVGCSNTATNTSTNTTNTNVEAGIETSTKESTLLVYGEVKVDQIEELQIDFPARITDVIAKKGTVVNQGDVLFNLDYSDYNLQISTLEKELRGYELEINGLNNTSNATAANINALSKELALKKSYTSSGQDPDILPLQNSLITLNEDLAQAKKTYESNTALFEAGALSENELQTSKLAYEKLNQKISDTNTSIKKLQDARNLEISTLQSKLNATSLEVSNNDTSKASKINQLQVKIESTTLTLQNMKNKLTEPYLKDKQIIAPKDNLIIYDVAVTPGSSVVGLGQPLVKFMDLNKLYVVVDIPEESLSSVTLNAPVTLKIADKNVDTPITGTISSISSFATEKEDDTVVEANIEITSGREYLKPGLSIDAYIETQS